MEREKGEVRSEKVKYSWRRLARQTSRHRSGALKGRKNKAQGKGAQRLPPWVKRHPPSSGLARRQRAKPNGKETVWIASLPRAQSRTKIFVDVKNEIINDFFMVLVSIF